MEHRWYNFYDPGVPTSIVYPQVTLRDLLERNAKFFPEKPFLIFNDIIISYASCNTMANKLAQGLLGLGVKKNDRVALMAPNIPQYVIALMACFKIGAIAVPTNPLYTVPEITHQFTDSGSETVIVMAAFADKVVQVMQQESSIVKRTVVAQVPGKQIELPDSENVFDFDELIAGAENVDPDIKVSPEDIAMLQYTGGTTGSPKGCMLSNFNLVAMAAQDSAWYSPMVALSEIRTLAAVPLYHIYGYNLNVNLALYVAGSVVLVAQPSVDNLLAAINQHKPTCFNAVPAMIIGLNQHPDTPQSKIKEIRGMVCGSAPLPVEAFKRFEELSGARIVEGYGMSETSNIVTGNPAYTRRKIGSVGVPFPDVDIRIVDLEDGTTEMPMGEKGELICRGPQLMSGYWENPEETADSLRDGWLYTGDIAYMDEDGFIFIVDRKKDMLICSGFNVYPRDIDEVMFTHPKVIEACTIGVPDPKRGETVKVFVVLKPGESMTEQEVIDYCKERLAGYKVPKLVEFIDELPRTSVGKADRKALREWEKSRMK